jgi:hypothetical protein
MKFKNFIICFILVYLFSCNIYTKEDVNEGENLILRIIIKIRGSNNESIQFKMFKNKKLEISTGEIQIIEDTFLSDNFDKSLKFIDFDFKEIVYLSENDFAIFKTLLDEFNNWTKKINNPTLKGANQIYVLSKKKSVFYFLPNIEDTIDPSYLLLKFIINKIPIKFRNNQRLKLLYK